ncbi:MAG: FxsA family protein [Nocardioides sp.]|nr:FxsA family protein [Nocardioides sp.]
MGIPRLEIYVLIQVGQVIGVGWTILLLIADSLFGGWLIRREGGRAFRALGEALGSGRMPAKELADGALILVGGILMLSPGFVLDVVGLVLILPFTRPLARGVLSKVIATRLLAGMAGPVTGFGNDERPRPGSRGTVVEGEVIPEDPDDPLD